MTQTQPTVYALRSPLYATTPGTRDEAGSFIQIPAGVTFIELATAGDQAPGDARLRLIKAGSLSGMIVRVESRHWDRASYSPPVVIKAKAGNLYYGGPAYPIADVKLPEADFEPILEAVKASIKKASNFEARGPIIIECRIAGDGWDVTFEYGMDELLAAAAAEREAREAGR